MEGDPAPDARRARDRIPTFDPARTGFDHIGLDFRDDLVERHGVTHTPVVDREYGSVLTFKDPDRIQFEMFYLDPALAG